MVVLITNLHNENRLHFVVLKVQSKVNYKTTDS